MMIHDTSLDIASNHSLCVCDCVWTRHNALLDGLTDDDDNINPHTFEESVASLTLLASSNRETDVLEGWPGNCRSFNGSDLGSSDTTNSSHSSFFNVKEKSERPIPRRQTGRILSLRDNEKASNFQPHNSLLGLLEGTKTYDFTPELVSPKKISNIPPSALLRGQQKQLHSVLSGILDESIHICDELQRSSSTRQSASSSCTQVNQSSEQQQEWKGKRNEMKLRKNKRGMADVLNPWHDSLVCKASALRRHESYVAPMKRKTSINSKSNNSLESFLSCQKKHSKKNYIIEAEEQSGSVSSVSCTSVDSDISFKSNIDVMPSPPRQVPEISTYNSFPSPKTANNSKKSLSMSNRGRDLHRSISSIVTTDSQLPNSQRSSDDLAPKQPRRCHSPPRRSAVPTAAKQ